MYLTLLVSYVDVAFVTNAAILHQLDTLKRFIDVWRQFFLSYADVEFLH